jgi:AhpD family alkylhydroperoxidase
MTQTQTIRTTRKPSRSPSWTLLGALLALALPAAATPALAAPSAADAARADIQKTFGFVPDSIQALPDSVLPSLWAQVKGYELASTALPNKVKQLIGLAVSAQLACPKCNYMYTKCARSAGATPAEIGETVAVAGQARFWSTYFNGTQVDETRFRADLKKLIDNVTRAAAAKTPPPSPVNVVDAKSALKDIEQSFGFVPEFLKGFPAEALPGAWLGMRDVEMDPGTALSGKHKTLISLAVASQIPCRYCVIADTEFARLEGASDKEIREAVAMAGITRNFLTLLEGMGVDDKTVRRDADRLNPAKAAKPVAAR